MATLHICRDPAAPLHVHTVCSHNLGAGLVAHARLQDSALVGVVLSSSGTCGDLGSHPTLQDNRVAEAAAPAYGTALFTDPVVAKAAGANDAATASLAAMKPHGPSFFGDVQRAAAAAASPALDVVLCCTEDAYRAVVEYYRSVGRPRGGAATHVVHLVGPEERQPDLCCAFVADVLLAQATQGLPVAARLEAGLGSFSRMRRTEARVWLA